jgi:hypothetical protein
MEEVKVKGISRKDAKSAKKTEEKTGVGVDPYFETAS